MLFVPQFSNQDLRLLADMDEVEIETPRASGDRARRTIIWIVVDGDAAFIRSVRGDTGAWYQAVRDGRPARLNAGSSSWAIRTSAVSDPVVIGRVSEAIERKYTARWPGPTAAMLRQEVLPTTLRVEPA